MTSLSRRKRQITALAKSIPSRKACSLTVLALLWCGKLASAAEPARVYPQAPAYEPVFVSSKKPLPSPPSAVLAKPISIPAAVVAPLAPPATNVVLAQVVEPPPETVRPRVEDDLKQYQILLEPPSPYDLFGRLESEKNVEKRMRQQAMQRTPPDTVQFPDKPVVSKAAYQARALPPRTFFAEPAFVCHDRLYFEERNAERYGWDLGFIQPWVSTAYFLRDALNVPIIFASRPFQRFDTSAGKCLPGDPVPYICYPPELSGIAKAASVGLIAAFP